MGNRRRDSKRAILRPHEGLKAKQNINYDPPHPMKNKDIGKINSNKHKMEIWKKIDGYATYEISNYGRVRSFSFKNRKDGRPSLRLEKFLIPYVRGKNKHPNSGYYSVSLSKESSVKRVKIHLLVSKYFIPNPNNYPIVNHIDGNRFNNKYDNLEWTTQSNNMIQSHKLRKLKP